MATLVLGTDKSSKVSSIIKKVPIPMPPAIYKAIDEDGKLVNGSTIVDLQGATDVGDYGLYYSYYNNNNIIGAVDLSSLTTISGYNGCSNMFCFCSGITSVDLSSLTTISGGGGCQDMFWFCSGITSVDLSSLTTISGGGGCQSMFSGCTGLTSVDLSNLATVSGDNGCNGMFQSCTGLTSVDLSNLTIVSGSSGCQSMFYNCTGLTSVDLSSLTTIYRQSGCNGMFYGCTSLTTLSFPSLNSSSFGTEYKNQFQGLVSGITGCTIHFPLNLNPQTGCTTISSLTNYPNFGGTGTTLLYDLPPTETVYTVSITAPSGSTIIINGEETDNIIVLPGKTVTYLVTLPGYLPYIRTIDSVETDIDIVLTESDFDAAITTLDVNYDNIDEQLTTTLANVIINDQFEKNDSLMALTSGNSSYNIKNGTSYGYITYTPTNDAILSIDGFVSSEKNYDLGAVYVGTQIYQPNPIQIKSKITDGNGEYLFTESGPGVSKTYNMNLTPGITYYINLIYAKDSSGNSGEDRIIIKQIQIIEKA